MAWTGVTPLSHPCSCRTNAKGSCEIHTASARSGTNVIAGHSDQARVGRSVEIFRREFGETESCGELGASSTSSRTFEADIPRCTCGVIYVQHVKQQLEWPFLIEVIQNAFLFLLGDVIILKSG